MFDKLRSNMRDWRPSAKALAGLAKVGGSGKDSPKAVAANQAALKALIIDCGVLLTERGEPNSVALASKALARYQALPSQLRLAFFEQLAALFDPDPGEVLIMAERFAVNRDPKNLIQLSKAAEPPRQELLRRLNRAPGGAATLVHMREHLLQLLPANPQLAAVDADFAHLLSSWFNPGFLQLRRLDWHSPAYLLEQLMTHEAVHEIDGWGDLRRRLMPDRRCFSFFHPMLPDEPLIFVEVALTDLMPDNISPLIDPKSTPLEQEKKFKVAVFYSISNCQPGLRGVNLGNFLIKRVAQELHVEYAQIKTFCTLSPLPGFAAWLKQTSDSTWQSDRLSAKQQSAVKELAVQMKRLVEDSGDMQSIASKAALQRLAGFYLLHTNSSVEATNCHDPVARFHLNNGALLERVNPGADLSRKGLKQSHGVMVNYLYDLAQIEENHTQFIAGRVAASRRVLSLF
jgi:malonyl-CoA decarboxylase